MLRTHMKNVLTPQPSNSDLINDSKMMQIEQDYMDMLKSFEDNRQDKRRKIITGTIKIQRFWRIYKTTKYLKSISRIQR